MAPFKCNLDSQNKARRRNSMHSSGEEVIIDNVSLTASECDAIAETQSKLEHLERYSVVPPVVARPIRPSIKARRHSCAPSYLNSMKVREDVTGRKSRSPRPLHNKTRRRQSLIGPAKIQDDSTTDRQKHLQYDVEVFARLDQAEKAFAQKVKENSELQEKLESALSERNRALNEMNRALSMAEKTINQVRNYKSRWEEVKLRDTKKERQPHKSTGLGQKIGKRVSIKTREMH